MVEEDYEQATAKKGEASYEPEDETGTKKAEKQLQNSLNAQNENSVIPNSSMTAKGGSSFSI